MKKIPIYSTENTTIIIFSFAVVISLIIRYMFHNISISDDLFVMLIMLFFYILFVGTFKLISYLSYSIVITDESITGPFKFYTRKRVTLLRNQVIGFKLINGSDRCKLIIRGSSEQLFIETPFITKKEATIAKNALEEIGIVEICS